MFSLVYLVPLVSVENNVGCRRRSSTVDYGIYVVNIVCCKCCILYVVFSMGYFRRRVCLEWATLLEDISSPYMTVGDW